MQVVEFSLDEGYRMLNRGLLNEATRIIAVLRFSPSLPKWAI